MADRLKWMTAVRESEGTVGGGELDENWRTVPGKLDVLEIL